MQGKKKLRISLKIWNFSIYTQVFIKNLTLLYKTNNYFIFSIITVITKKPSKM